MPCVAEQGVTPSQTELLLPHSKGGCRHSRRQRRASDRCPPPTYAAAAAAAWASTSLDEEVGPQAIHPVWCRCSTSPPGGGVAYLHMIGLYLAGGAAHHFLLHSSKHICQHNGNSHTPLPHTKASLGMASERRIRGVPKAPLVNVACFLMGLTCTCRVDNTQKNTTIRHVAMSSPKRSWPSICIQTRTPKARKSSPPSLPFPCQTSVSLPQHPIPVALQQRTTRLIIVASSDTCSGTCMAVRIDESHSLLPKCMGERCGSAACLQSRLRRFQALRKTWCVRVQRRVRVAFFERNAHL